MSTDQTPYTDDGEPHSIPGTIQAEDFDEGGEGVAYHDTDAQNSGGAYRDTSVDIKEYPDGAHHVGWTEPDEWIEYTVRVEPGTYTVTASLSSPGGEGTLALALDGEERATFDAPQTADWGTTETVSVSDVALPQTDRGVLRATVVDDGFNIDSIRFEQTSAPDSESGSESESDDGSPNDGAGNGYGGGRGETFVGNFDGGDLAAKLTAALDSLPGGAGRVRLRPRVDGEPWQLPAEGMTINPRDYRGVEIDVDRFVEIEYPGDGWGLTFDTDGGYQESPNNRIDLTGGIWRATGTPEGMIRLMDVIRGTVRPEQVEAYNDAGTAVGVSIENHAQYAEMNQVSRAKIDADICIDYRGASDTGGSGTDSFHGNQVVDTYLSPKSVGIRTDGAWQYGAIRENQIFIADDGACGVELGASRMDGTVVSANKIEEADVSYTDTVGYRSPDGGLGYFYAPLVLGGLVDGPKSSASGIARLPYVQVRGPGIGIYDLTTGKNSQGGKRIALDPKFDGISAAGNKIDDVERIVFEDGTEVNSTDF